MDGEDWRCTMMGAGDGALNEGGVASNEAGGALKEF